MRSKKRQRDLDNLKRVANASRLVDRKADSFGLSTPVLYTQFMQGEKALPRGFAIGYADFWVIGDRFGEVYIREILYKSHDCTLREETPVRFSVTGKKIRILSAVNAELYSEEFKKSEN